MNERCLILLVATIYLEQLMCAVDSHIVAISATRYVFITEQLCISKAEARPSMQSKTKYGPV